MTQEHIDLLTKDLSARLPYGVKVNNEIQGDFTVYGICENFIFGRTEVCHIDFPVEKIKPYLFPLSSMTEEQQTEANIFDDMDMDILSENLGRNQRNKTNIPTATYNYTDWLNKNHFDYRGLIPMGLAIDATRLNIY